jgi:predicted 3-demethylubiquinone-9 3-methyltransferase (glyoxalase superfamily)
LQYFEQEIKHALSQKITPCLWFYDQAQQAAKFYTGIFKNSKIKKISRYGKEGYEIHHRPEGSVMTVEFELDGQAFTALNGGPLCKFNEAVSFQVDCATQEELDHYWEKLSEGGTVRLAQRQIRAVVADRSARSGRHAQ